MSLSFNFNYYPEDTADSWKYQKTSKDNKIQVSWWLQVMYNTVFAISVLILYVNFHRDKRK